MPKLAWLLCLIVSLQGFAQNKPRAILDTVLRRARETSLYRNNIAWDSLEQAVYARAGKAATIQELKSAFETLLNGMRDHHGKLMNAKDYSYLAWFTDGKNKRYADNRTFDQATWSIVNDTAAHFSSALLQNKIGYLRIVGIAPNVDVEKEARVIRQAIQTFARQHVKHWIIDLRYNGGGNMNPMLAGLAPLIGQGIVGGLVDLNQKRILDWKIIGSDFHYGDMATVALPDDSKLISNPKIAVLTSRWTVSSGEIVATALKGKPNTRFFGEATGGYTTNDGWDVIGDEVILVISTGVFCDRNGTVYEHTIPVDVAIPFEVTADPSKDTGITAAINWLQLN